MICTHQQSSIVYIYTYFDLPSGNNKQFNSLGHGHSHHVKTRVNLRPKWTMASTAKCPLGLETTENYQYLMVKTTADSRSVHQDSKLAAVLRRCVVHFFFCGYISLFLYQFQKDIIIVSTWKWTYFGVKSPILGTLLCC